MKPKKCRLWVDEFTARKIKINAVKLGKSQEKFLKELADSYENSEQKNEKTREKIF